MDSERTRRRGAYAGRCGSATLGMFEMGMPHWSAQMLAIGSARRRLSNYLSACALCWMVAPGCHAADTVERHLAALRAALDTRVIETLDAIDGTGRQLLAVRSYVR